MEKYDLTDVPLFKGIEPQNIDNMLSCLDVRIRNYQKGEMIFREGDEAKYVGLVLEGCVQVVRDDFYGKRTILTTVKEKQLFAETFSCAEVKTLPIGVYAKEDTKVMLLNCKRIIQSCSNACMFHSMLIHNLLKIVVQKNLLLNNKIEIISKKTTKEKIMAFLMAKAKECRSSTFIIEYDRQSLADYLGVERSAMSAEISKLKRDGYIEVKNNHFHILKPFIV